MRRTTSACSAMSVSSRSPYSLMVRSLTPIASPKTCPSEQSVTRAPGSWRSPIECASSASAASASRSPSSGSVPHTLSRFGDLHGNAGSASSMRVPAVIAAVMLARCSGQSVGSTETVPRARSSSRRSTRSARTVTSLSVLASTDAARRIGRATGPRASGACRYVVASASPSSAMPGTASSVRSMISSSAFASDDAGQ